MTDIPDAARADSEPWRPLQTLLLVLTVLACLVAGTTFLPRYADFGMMEHLGRLAAHPALLLDGAPFALPLLLILGVHEMGHFLSARRRGIRVTWPYFLPGPPFISLGTFGAFIRLKGPIPDRGALMEVGANGPLWGFAASVAVAVAGFALGLAGIRMPTDLGVNVHLPLAFWWLRGTFTGHWALSLTFFDNPLLLAAWLGFFVQGLNLLPVGQLDGGHVLYAFAGVRHRAMSLAVGLLFLAFAVFHPQWLLWVGLVFFVLGLRHPPTMNDARGLDAEQVLRGVGAGLVFLLCFVPVPFA